MWGSESLGGQESEDIIKAEKETFKGPIFGMKNKKMKKDRVWHL